MFSCAGVTLSARTGCATCPHLPSLLPCSARFRPAFAIHALQLVLASDFACSVNSNQRKGGLLGLSSCAMALVPYTADHLDVLVPTILKSFAVRR